MKKKQIDRVTIFGAVLGTASFLFPIFSLKANRVADCVHISWFEVGNTYLIIIIILLLIVLIFIALRGSVSEYPQWKACISLLLFVLLFIVTGLEGNRLITDADPFGRISLSSGFWIYLAALWIIFNGVFRSYNHNWRGLLIKVMLLTVIMVTFIIGFFDDLSLTMEYILKKERLLEELLNHLKLAGSAVLFSLILGLPLGVLSWKKKRGEKVIFFFLNSVQTIPSLALFGLLIAPLSYLSFHYPFLRDMGIMGIGAAPALIALTLYALLPIARNTHIALSVVDPDILLAGKAMGMGSFELFFTVEVPLALPVILTGVRISSIQAIGNTAVAALIGAGGLGVFIFQGLGQGAPDLILLGVLPVIILAVGLDRLLSIIIDFSTSPGIKGSDYD